MPYTTASTPAAAKLRFVPLRNCLVNLPGLLVDSLSSSNTPAQDVIVELQAPAPNSRSRAEDHGGPFSIYVGWTGFASSHGEPTSLSQEDVSISRVRSSGFVDIDGTYGASLGLVSGQSVGVLVHGDAPGADYVHIEPLTEADWEIIELHASFLETNFFSQARALPNPAASQEARAKVRPSQHLTLHLSPTTTANIAITSVAPPVLSTVPFAKLLPNAEVVVAPKVRTQKSPTGDTAKANPRLPGASDLDSSSARQGRWDQVAWLLGTDLTCVQTLPIQERKPAANGLTISLSPEASEMDHIEDFPWVTVSLSGSARPETSIYSSIKQRAEDSVYEKVWSGGRTVVAHLLVWDSAPGPQHALLSPSLCACLGARGIVGRPVHVQQAPRPLPLHKVKSVVLHPFRSPGIYRPLPLKISQRTKDARSALVDMIQETYSDGRFDLLAGPLTDGMIIPLSGTNGPQGWTGTGLRLELKAGLSNEEWESLWWFFNEGQAKPGEVRAEIDFPVWHPAARPSAQDTNSGVPPQLAGLGLLPQRVVDWLVQGASVLVTGSIGSGKTSFAQLIAHTLRQERRFHTSFVDCKKLSTTDVRVSAIKETLDRLFLEAVQSAQLGGFSLIIFDNLENLCAAETELQVGQDNERNRQVGELFGYVVRGACSAEPNVRLLATASGNDALHAAINSSGVFGESLSLKAPNKDQRVKIITLLSQKLAKSSKNYSPNQENGHTAHGNRRRSLSSQELVDNAQSDQLDMLEVANRTDGFMPRDISLLVDKALTERLIRVSTNSSASNSGVRTLDFLTALKSFTPASLRNLPLTSSSTTFSSVGGLDDTRSILLETLQYPTTYAPIFQQSALRLRSGILLFGYPGCGKTLLASAIAGECGLNFISVKGPEILNKYIGASEKSVRDLFERAEAARPCILFFDEFDSLAPKRGHDSTGVTDRVVNQLLTQLDGAEGLTGVYVFAATSRPDLIDPALLRPGRLDKSLLCDLPSAKERVEILQSLARGLEVDTQIQQATKKPNSSFWEIARRTEGYTGADLQAVVYNAHLHAIQDTLKDQRTRSDIVTGSRGEAAVSLGTGKETMEFKFGQKPTNSGHYPERPTSSADGSGAASKVLRDLESVKRARRNWSVGPVGQGQRSNSKRSFRPHIVIGWKHFEAALTETRRSISDAERKRLQAIYGEFLRSRSGEMPSGEASTDVGGRSSLM